MILSKPQAEAVYSAMCELNNVSGYLDAVMQGVRVKEHANGVVQITSIGASEDYASQAAFATAYGLSSDEPQSDVAAAAGGATQTAIER